MTCKARRRIGWFTLVTAAVILTGVIPADLPAEIIKVSRLKKTQEEFTVKRDIFSPIKRNSTAPRPIRPVAPPPVNKEELKQKDQVEIDADVVEEVRSNVIYEGYAFRKGKKVALLTVNGEYFAVAKDEMVLDKMTVIAITNEAITVDMEGAQIEINVKGDDTNEEENFNATQKQKMRNMPRPRR